MKKWKPRLLSKSWLKSDFWKPNSSVFCQKWKRPHQQRHLLSKGWTNATNIVGKYWMVSKSKIQIQNFYIYIFSNFIAIKIQLFSLYLQAACLHCLQVKDREQIQFEKFFWRRRRLSQKSRSKILSDSIFKFSRRGANLFLKQFVMSSPFDIW